MLIVWSQQYTRKRDTTFTRSKARFTSLRFAIPHRETLECELVRISKMEPRTSYEVWIYVYRQLDRLSLVGMRAGFAAVACGLEERVGHRHTKGSGREGDLPVA